MQNLPSFRLVGRNCRTTNENQQAHKDIMAMWQQFFADGVPAQVSGKRNEDFIGMFTDYENGREGAYTAWVGFQVDDDAPLPEGLSEIRVPEALYQVYHAEGKFPEVVFETWQSAYADEDAGAIDRSYVADFEVYPADQTDPDTGKVTVYVGLK